MKSKEQENSTTSTTTTTTLTPSIITTSATATPTAVHSSTLPDLKVSTTSENKKEDHSRPTDPAAMAQKIIKEEETQFFQSMQVLHQEVLVEQEKKSRSRKPSLSVLTTPQLSQSTTTVPDMTLLDSLSHISQASSLDSDDDYGDDDFESLSRSLSASMSGVGRQLDSAEGVGALRPARPTTPLSSSAFYRRQNIVLGGGRGGRGSRQIKEE